MLKFKHTIRRLKIKMTLVTRVNTRLLHHLKPGFKRIISWNKYKSKHQCRRVASTKKIFCL